MERESERKKIERKRKFLLLLLVKYPERRSGKLNKLNILFFFCYKITEI